MQPQAIEYQSAPVFCLRKARVADLFIGVYLTHNPSLDKEYCLVHSLSVLKYAFFGLEEVAAGEKSITEAFFLQESSWEAIEEDFNSWQGQYST